MRNGIVIDKHDNVVVAIYQLTGGDEVTYTLPDGTEDTLTATQDIPCSTRSPAPTSPRASAW